MPYHYPVHQHDCNRCIFVGTDTPEPGEISTDDPDHSTRQVDLYVCQSRRDPSWLTLIRRFSSLGRDYSSRTFPINDPTEMARISPRYQRVLDAWNDKE